MSKLDTGHGPFVELMNLGRVFVVPDYQRPYSWKPQKQVAELWSDVVRLYRALVDDGDRDSHFIGSVVIGQASTKALGPVQCPVIDGQQRLITLTLMIAAIRDSLVVDPDDQRDITAQYLAHFKGDEIASLRVQPGATDLAAYESLIRGTGTAPRSSLVTRSYNFIADQLASGPVEYTDPDEAPAPVLADDAAPNDVEPDDVEPDENGYEDLDDLPDREGDTTVTWDWETLLSVVGTQLELVSISDVAPENAYQIFATLNSTGLPLAQVDLVRNGIFMLLPKAGAKAHKDLWIPMESTMGKDLLQSYLHTWVIRRGHNVPAKEIYRSAIYELQRAGKETDILRELKALHSGAWTYMLLTRPTSSDRAKFGEGVGTPKTLIDALARLRAWGTVPMEPLLFEILERYRAGHLSLTQVRQMLTFLESFVVRRFIAQVPPNDLRSTFARLVQQVRKKTSPAAFEAGVLDALREPGRRWPTDAELEDSLLRRPLYRSPGQGQSFFVLKRLAEELEGKEAPQITFGRTSTDYSIEHVLPQSFPTSWQDDLATWGDPGPQETWATRRHTAGNLTLTAYNSELAALPFDDPALKMDKKRWIKAHLRLQLSRDILKSDVWTRAEIEARSVSLAQLAKSIWPRPDHS